jgi:flagellar biosynthesis/type III secretory pathway protein FliH
MEAALEEDRERVRRLLAELGKAILEGRRASVPQWQEVADALADGALQIARAAVARELRSIDDPVAEAVRSALQAISEPGQAVVHLHPEDATFAGRQPPEGIRVVADASVPPGSVLVLTPAQRLLIDLPTALSAAERVLRS